MPHEFVSQIETILLPNILPIIGRYDELAAIDAAFRRDAHVVTITGPFGIGKTTVASAFAQQHRDEFPGGIFTGKAWDEPVDRFINRIVPTPPRDRALVVIDEATALKDSDLESFKRYVNSQPNLQFILITQMPLPLSPIRNEIVELAGFSVTEAEELIRLHNAITDSTLDKETARRLFELTGGNPRTIQMAAAAVGSGEFKTWIELFSYLHDFGTSGILGPDGRPLGEVSEEKSIIIADVTQANEEILTMLKNKPELSWQLPPRRFEEIVAELLGRQGYTITLTPASGDGGFDMYAAKKDGLGQFLYLVECKRYVPPNKVGVEVVRALHGVLQAECATAGAIVTTSYFTKGADSFSRKFKHQMHLHDYVVFQKWLRSL